MAQEWRKELRAIRQELHKVEEKFKNVNDDLAKIMETTDLAIMICASDGTIQYANQKAKELFGFHDIIGRTILVVAMNYDLQKIVEKALLGEIVQTVEEVTITYPESRNILVRISNLQGGRVLLAIRDMTEIRRLERVRSDFVGNLSHELRTPMATIRAMAETINDDEQLPEKKRHQYLDKIISEIDRLTLLSEDLLVLTMAESQAAELSLTDFAEVVRYVGQQYEAQAQERGLSLCVQTPETLPVSANRNQLVQVVVNLVSNAIRYTVSGGVTLWLEIKDEQAVLSVIDTGIGISKEHQARIFERFYRVDKARSRDTGGTGLGLSIVRHIVESHGGKIEVESELNQGSTFRVLLPLG